MSEAREIYRSLFAAATASEPVQQLRNAIVKTAMTAEEAKAGATALATKSGWNRLGHVLLGAGLLVPPALLLGKLYGEKKRKEGKMTGFSSGLAAGMATPALIDAVKRTMSPNPGEEEFTSI